MTIAEKNLRSLRIIHIAFVFAAVAYAVVPLPSRSGLHVHLTIMLFEYGTVALALGTASIFIRISVVQPAIAALRDNPEDGAAVGRWRAGILLSLVFSEALVLSGMMLRLVGASWNIYGVFYATGIFFLLVCKPRLELPPS
jgi:nitrate/nitrite transporter NarK